MQRSRARQGSSVPASRTGGHGIIRGVDDAQALFRQLDSRQNVIADAGAVDLDLHQLPLRIVAAPGIADAAQHAQGNAAMLRQLIQVIQRRAGDVIRRGE